MNRPSKRKLISIACLCYNEKDNIEEAYGQILWLIRKCPQYDFEIVVADNGSTDGTREILREIAENDSRLKVIFNMSNYGVDQSSANLLSSLSGDAYISYPVDMQEPIELLPEMLEAWESGFDVVWGQKTRSGENGLKYKLRSIYYDLIDFFSYHKIPHQVTGFGVTDRTVLDAIIRCKLQDPHIPARVLVPELGCKVKLIPYRQNARKAGKSSYDAARFIDFGINSLCGNSTKPLRFMMLLGGGLTVMTLLAIVVCIVVGVVVPGAVDARFASVVLIMLLALGITMFCLGLVAEYISLIMRKVTNKTVVVEEERMNFVDNTPQILIGGFRGQKFDARKRELTGSASANRGD